VLSIAAAIADVHVEARCRHRPRRIQVICRSQPVVIGTVGETDRRIRRREVGVATLDLDRIEVHIRADEELARLLKSGPTPEELQRVKTEYIAGYIRGIERIGGFGGTSDRLAQSQVFCGDPAAYKISLKRVQNATAEDLRTAADRWLTDGVFILEVHPFPEYKTASSGADRSKMPDPGTPPELKLPKLQRDSLSNGLKLILAERHDVPLVQFWMTLDGGYAADQFAAPGTASMTTALLDGGTKTRTALQISDQLELLGAELHANSNLDLTTVRLSTLKSKLDPSLDLFADVILNPSFPESDFKRQQKLQLAAIQREQNTPVQMVFRVVPGLLYGKDHAYGNPLTGSGNLATVSKMTREDLVKFHDVWFRPNNATVIVVGDTTLAEMKPKLEKLFAAWKAGDVPRKNIGDVGAPATSVVYLIDKPGALQSVIVAGAVVAPPSTPDEIAINAMNDALGGTFGSRLNMNLREDKHWSYGAQSRLFRARGQRPFLAIAPVQTDKTKDSLAEMNKEFRGITGDRPVSAEELVRIQLNETLSLPGSRETSDEVGQSVLELVQFGWPDDYYGTMAGKIRALNTGNLNDAAKELIHPDKIIWVVVGDRAKIEAGVREVGLGEVRLLSPDGKPLAAAGGQ